MTRSTSEAILTVSYAIQSLIEALQKVEAHLPASERQQFAEALQRARRARVELAGWAEEMR